MHLSLVAECRERCDRALPKLQTNAMLDARRGVAADRPGNSLFYTRPRPSRQTVLPGANPLCFG
jgi:hypothetical protein